ncbi:MAG: TonB family protein [Pyrinomonadaceae bacterium]
MKNPLFSRPLSFAGKILFCLCVVNVAAVAVMAQASLDSAPDSVQRRITRARALSAVGNLPAARSELEALMREPGADESVREIALVLLVGVYLDQSDYGFAENALNDAFRQRTATPGDGSTRAYFAVAGQVINGVRQHLERYRTFNLNVADASLPEEAAGDVERLRGLLERVIAQGKSLSDEQGRAVDASALIEDAATLRSRLARGDGERTQWQREVAEARQRIMGTDRRVSSVAATSSAPVATAAPPAAANANPGAEAGPASGNPAGTNAPANAAPAGNANHAAAATTTSAPAAPPVNAKSAPPTAGAAPSSSSSAHGQPARVGSLLSYARHRVQPSYPATARAARAAGKVTVFLVVDEKGTVAAIERSEGHELLRRAAEDAARRWKFNPTIINGQPARVSGYLTFDFTM